MNGLEALENIAITFDEGGYEPTTLGAKSGHFIEVFRVEFNIIEQDLKRLRQKQLEEKNKELNEKLNKLNKELVIERDVRGMTSKEKIRDIKSVINEFYHNTKCNNDLTNDARGCWLTYQKYCDEIKQDLERLEMLEKENAKIKKIIDILKVKRIQNRFLKESKNVDEYNKWVSNLMNIRELSKEEYELLKEVLENG